MDFKQAFITCAIEKRFNWQDRACRSEFWWFYLATVAIGIIASLFNTIPLIGQVISLVINIAIWWLSIVASIRRLHDIDKSGFWILLPAGASIVGITMLAIGLFGGSDLLFALGIIVGLGGTGYMIFLLVQPGTPGPNKYGPNPLATAAYNAPDMSATTANDMSAPADNNMSEPAANETLSAANEETPATSEAQPQDKNNQQ
ncbi:MAG: DUF805 domain-containing protein [Anaerobiospirillum succiniciproducens]|uniref:DUF805 domain-containing protein n=1 Tax=Anaerobiospirillum succiniciproducens TaxID=13335 RepID=UPI002352CDC8|nr:DUF805 domain-containing protein [Anaerobiospirillum succiniciproducens]MCI6864479.1 DUF805 domain-containing protein [Anaerobiospirillum succiniciproducens]MDY2798208.1 DUF805 domain-containing protein [Anaerobiospirillum succiniciproducens]